MPSLVWIGFWNTGLWNNHCFKSIILPRNHRNYSSIFKHTILLLYVSILFVASPMGYIWGTVSSSLILCVCVYSKVWPTKDKGPCFQLCLLRLVPCDTILMNTTRHIWVNCPVLDKIVLLSIIRISASLAFLQSMNTVKGCPAHGDSEECQEKPRIKM